MSLVQTLTQNFRARYQAETLDKNEIKQSRYGAWDFFQQQSKVMGGVMTDQVQQLIKRSFGNTVKVPVLDAETVSISNTRSCTVTDSENTSKLVTLTFVTYSFGFTMVPSQHYNNDVGYQDDFNRKLKKYLLQLASVLDTASVNTLETVRNQYFPTDITNYYPNVGNSLQVTAAQRNDFFNKASAILETMDYYDTPHVVGSTSLNPMINRLQAQGGGNATNEAFQFDRYKWHTTNRLINANGIESTMYLVNNGSVAVSNRNNPDAIAGRKTGNGKIWGLANMPIVNLEMGTYYYDDCADKSGLHSGTVDLTRTAVEAYAFDTDVVFMTAYNSDAANRYSPIVKAEVSMT